jgi:hypothetical protein
MKLLTALFCVIVASTALAQPAPPEVRPGDREGERPQRPERPDRMDRPDRPDQRGGPEMGTMMRQVEVMRGFLEVVERYSRLAHDPSNAGVAAVIGAHEILKSQGPEAGIEYFSKLLPEVKNAAVHRAIQIQLADLYKNSGQKDKALEQLRALMIEAPAGEPAPPRRVE